MIRHQQLRLYRSAPARKGPRETPRVAYVRVVTPRGHRPISEHGMEKALDGLRLFAGEAALTGERGTIRVVPGEMLEVYGGAEAWAGVLRAYLRGLGLIPRVVVGFDEIAVRRLSHGPAAVIVLENREAERVAFEAA